MIRRPFRAGLLLASGVLGAVLVGQVPALGATGLHSSATPASAGQRLVCPGSAVGVGAAGTAAASLTATGKPVRVVGTANGAKTTSTGLKKGGITGGGASARLITAPAAAPAAGPLAAAQLEAVTSGDVAGLVAATCAEPTSVQWFAAGSTATGRTSVLTLANASAVESDVRVRIWTEDGPGPGDEIVVPGGTRKAVSLAGLVQGAAGTVVEVQASGGLVAAALEQRTVRGLESGGLDITGPTAPPALQQTLTGLRILGSASVVSASRADGYADLVPVVRVFVPGAAATDVTITLRGAGGADTTLERRVAARTVTDFAFPGLADGTYTAQVTAKRPVIVGARASVVGDLGASTTPSDTTSSGSSGTSSTGTSTGTDAGLVGGDAPGSTGTASTGTATTGTASTGTVDGSVAATSTTSTARGIDLAWFAAAPTLGDTAAVAVVAGPTPQLTIANPTRDAATVRLSGASTITVAVPAGATVTTGVAAGVITLRGAAGLVAAVSFAGSDAIAGYPVQAADQAAHAITVSP